MSDITDNLSLPYILAQQAQKHVPHNEAILMLDALVQIVVASRTVTAPPGGTVDGDRYIIPAAATGAWAGEDGKLAHKVDGAWRFFTVATGWAAWFLDDNSFRVFDGTDWSEFSSSGGGSMTGAQIISAIDAQLGSTAWQSGGGTQTGAQIAAALDTFFGDTDWQNGSGAEIIALIDAALGNTSWQTGGGTQTGAQIATALTAHFGNDDWEAGSGSEIVALIDAALGNTTWQSAGGGGGSVNPTSLVGVNATADTTNRLSVSSPAILFNNDGTDSQVKINKAATANTASLLFQNAFTGHAEFGLAGNNDFSIKVSPDGSTFNTAMTVDQTNGNIDMGLGVFTHRLGIHGDLMVNHRNETNNGVLIGDPPGLGFPGLWLGSNSANPSYLNYSFLYDNNQGTIFNTQSNIAFRISNVEQMKITSSGQIRFSNLATTSNAPNAFIDTGTGNRLLRSTSSGRYKTAVEPLDMNFAKALLVVKPVWYRSLCEADCPVHSWYGFIAEDVAAIDPRMVHWGYHDDQYKLEKADETGSKQKVLKRNAKKTPESVAYDRFVVHHHLLIKELFERVEKLEKL